MVVRMIYRAIKILWGFLPFKRELFTVLRYFWTPPESIYKHLHFHGDFSVEFEDRHFRVRHYGYQIENEIFWEGLLGHWEKISMGLWVELSKRSDVIMDIGANSGIYSLVSKAVNPSAVVHAFEPLPNIAMKLRHNIDLNNFDIICNEFGVSNQSGTATIYHVGRDHSYGASFDPAHAGASHDLIETDVRIETLANYILHNKIQAIDLIKMDVEGYEPEVLEGFGQLLAEMKPTMLLEILSDAAAGKIERMLRGLDYLYFDIDELHAPKRVANLAKSSRWNFLICTQDIASELGLLAKCAE